MLLGKIVGTVVATRKDPRLVSSKLLVVRPVDPSGKPEGNCLVAIDTVDALVIRTSCRFDPATLKVTVKRADGSPVESARMNSFTPVPVQSAGPFLVSPICPKSVEG